MSDLYSFEEDKEDEYIAFQVGHYKNGGDLNLINNELSKLHTKTGYQIKLVPIGNCSGHDDIISLSWLKRNANYQCEIIVPNSIETIMKAIAKSKLFIGTSLHGVITAMSFSVPYVALNPRISKLKGYVMTWAPKELKFSSDFNSIYNNSLEVLRVDKSILIKNAEMQKDLVWKSFQKISSLITSK
jgi:polysaccharide pyruvyl transferase WcaK-like protein